MKKTIAFFGALIAALSLSMSAAAREPVPIIEYVDLPVATASGKPVTADQVKSAISSAASARNWQLSKSPNQDLVSATLHVRGKHTVVVSIPYSSEKFSLKYESSMNMKFTPGDSSNLSQTSGSMGSGSTQAGANGPLIHPFYNRWVQDLLQAIKLELNKL